MRSWLVILALVLTPALAVRAHPQDENNHGPPSSTRIRGVKNGDYTLTTAGDYSGTGTGSVSDSAVSLYVELHLSDGSTITLSFNNMTRVNDRFQATATYGGLTFTLSGRVDLPAATDGDQTSAQAITGRVTAVLIDSAGKGTRIVAVQDEASRRTNGL